ncbi:MAG: MFS transporter [Myxococcota bacterium]
MALFGGLYFVQGVVEPTACLPSQPLQTGLRSSGLDATQVGAFFGGIGLAWSFKPVFGFASDFLPLFGTHRRSYLLLSTAAFALGFAALALAGLRSDTVGVHALVLGGIGVAIATTDVVVDAVAVEYGQSRGLTGPIQSVQWGANSAAAMLAGVAGGWLAERGGLSTTWVVCAALGVGSFALAALAVREPRHRERPSDNLRTAAAELRRTGRGWTLVGVALFQLLWNFNPFTFNVLQLYVTESLGLSESFYGGMMSVQSGAALLACGVYAVACRRVPFGVWIHLSIALQIASTLAFMFLVGPRSGMAVAFVFGLTYQLSSLVTLDLAARTCPPAAAATTFAVLMAVANTGGSLSIWAGGLGFDTLVEHTGSPTTAFHGLVAIGAASTALCWGAVPLLRRATLG